MAARRARLALNPYPGLTLELQYMKDEHLTADETRGIIYALQAAYVSAVCPARSLYSPGVCRTRD